MSVSSRSKSGRAIDTNTLLNLTTTSGLTAGETFDAIEFQASSSTQSVLSYMLAGTCIFQLVLELIDQTEFSITKRDCLFNLLQENGDFLLQENGDKLLIEGNVP